MDVSVHASCDHDDKKLCPDCDRLIEQARADREARAA